MTSPLMNHQDAVSTLAVERYLLGELKDEERAAFEEHYLNCAECLDAVTFGDEFMEAAQPVARDLALAGKSGHAPVPGRESGKFFARLLAVMRTPAPAWALVVCAFSVFTYQQVQLRSALTAAQSPRVVGESMFLPPAARDGDPQTQRGNRTEITVGRNESIPLDFDLPSDRAVFVSYQGQIFNESGRKILPAFSLSADKLALSNRVQLVVPSLENSGSYQLVIYGSGFGEKEKHVISRYDFVVKFEN
jgi:putative zinc finger protein